MCAWHGNSADLLRYEDNGKFQNPRMLQEFMLFIHQHISPLVGKELANLELVSREGTTENVAFLTKLLVDYSRAGFEAVLKGLLREAGEDEPTVH